MGFQGIVDLAKQIRQVGRALFRSPRFTFTAVVTMALSIGAITTMFSVIKAVLLHPVPYHAPARLVMLWSVAPRRDIQRNWTSYPDIQDRKRESRSFTEIAAMLRVDTADLTDAVPVERTKVGRVYSEFFSGLGVTPVLGRDWTQEEEDHRAQVAVISHAFWQSHFVGACNAIGASVEIDHKRAVVIGVMPAGFDCPSSETSIWIPLSLISNWPVFLTARQADAFNASARLEPGITWQRAQHEMDSISTGAFLADSQCGQKTARTMSRSVYVCKPLPFVGQFWGLIPTESLTFSSDRSYSPKRKVDVLPGGRRPLGHCI